MVMFPKGEWGRISSTVLGNGTLARICFQHGLDRCLNKDPFNPQATSVRLAADLLEAVMGAVEMDSGPTAVAQVMTSMGTDLHTMVTSKSLPNL